MIRTIDREGKLNDIKRLSFFRSWTSKSLYVVWGKSSTDIASDVFFNLGMGLSWGWNM